MVTARKPIQAAVDAFLARLEALEPGFASAPAALAARNLAGRVDDPKTSSTAAAACSKELREWLAKLESLAPVVADPTVVDEITARAAAKLRAAK